MDRNGFWFFKGEAQKFPANFARPPSRVLSETFVIFSQKGSQKCETISAHRKSTDLILRIFKKDTLCDTITVPKVRNA